MTRFYGLNTIESMLTKQQVISALRNMPDTFDTVELFDRILLLKKIEEGRNKSKKVNPI